MMNEVFPGGRVGNQGKIKGNNTGQRTYIYNNKKYGEITKDKNNATFNEWESYIAYGRGTDEKGAYDQWGINHK